MAYISVLRRGVHTEVHIAFRTCYNLIAPPNMSLSYMESGQDSDMFLHSFFVDLSSPQISAIFVGKFIRKMEVSAILRNSSCTNSAD